MAGVKSGAAGGGYNILERDVGRSDTKLGQLVQRLGKAKSTGAGIGGLLGGIVGQILIPIPGVGAAIGAGLGSLFGSKVGGATSGVDQGDILNSKFRKDSAHNMTTQIAQQEFADVAKSTVSSFMQGINPASSLSKFGSGFESGAGMGLDVTMADPSHISNQGFGSRFMGGMKGGFTDMMAKPPSAVKEAALPKLPDATKTSVPGMPTNLLDMGIQGDDFLGRYNENASGLVNENSLKSLGEGWWMKWKSGQLTDEEAMQVIESGG
jgi:hypothetical protein